MGRADGARPSRTARDGEKLRALYPRGGAARLTRTFPHMGPQGTSSDSPRLRARKAWWAAFIAATALTLLLPTGHTLREWLTNGMLARHGIPARPTTPWIVWTLREIPMWYGWLLLSPVILGVSVRFPLEGGRRIRNLGVHLATAALTISLQLLLVVAYQVMLFPQPGQQEFAFLEVYLGGLAAFAPTSLVVYASVVATQHAVLSSRALEARTLHAARLESRLAHAQLDVLRTQLQPHFLFNTLNTVQSLMHTNVQAAQATVLKLSDLLRRSLRGGTGHEVPLGEELAFLEEYISIQKTRFADRLAVRFEIEPDTTNLLVPQLLLQPLVENAIRHGLQPRPEPGTVVVRGVREGEHLVLEVMDDGVGLSAAPPPMEGEGGIGLRNTRARLQQLYGDAHEFSLTGGEPRGARVRIRIPARPGDEATAEFVELSDADPYRDR